MLNKHNLKWQTDQHIPDTNVRAKRFQYEKPSSTESLSFGNMETELSAIREIRRNTSQDGQSYEKRAIAQVSQSELDHVREVRRRRNSIDFDQPSQKDPTTMKHDTAMELEAIRCWRESERTISDEEPVKYPNRDVVQRELEALRRLRQQYPNVCEADCEVAYHNAALQKELQFIGHLRQKFNFQERLPPQTHDQRDIIQRELAALNYARKHLLSKANIEPDIQNVKQQNTVQRELEALRKLQKIGAFTPQGLFRDEATNTAIKRELEMVSLARRSGQYGPQEYLPMSQSGREGINQELEVLRRSKSCQQFNFDSHDTINPQRLSIAQELANIKEIRNSTHFTECLPSSLSQQEFEMHRQQRRRDIRTLRRSKSCNVSANAREDRKTTSVSQIQDPVKCRRARDQVSPKDEPNEPLAMSERDRIHLELEELRQIRRNSTISKISHGREDSLQKRRPYQRAVSVTSLDTGSNTVDSSSRSNDMIRAMFDSQAPKIRFGGSGNSMSSLPQITRRNSVKARKVKDKRKWVHDTNRKRIGYTHCSTKQLSTREDDNQSIFYPDTDSEDETGTPMSPSINQANSSTRLREMFHSTLNKVSSNLGTSKEILLRTIQKFTQQHVKD
ncbi:hypothetical protein TCAL_16334 [Tigriopus californicus]|uniref:Uncharacterized protein n=1 Tax=Tigriopus californicus TaxID=6832 RepID=A0A553N727_TIGCA|nr:hypothetical protein TCAL_16334 [Tigriopus californicus]